MSRIETESELLVEIVSLISRVVNPTLAMRCCVNSLDDLAEDLRTAIEEDEEANA